MSETVINALSIDVEEYFQAEAFAELVPRRQWETQSSRVEVGTGQLLELCARHQTKATFFILGWIAERHPQLIKEIAAQGHEIGCHGSEHQLIYNQSATEFRECVRKSKRILEDISQQQVLGFRAPTFSITEKSLWALDILMEEGFIYDSSIFPIKHDRYGIPKASRFPRKISEDRNFYEFPPSTLCLGGVNFPVAGGGYLRLLPFCYTKWGINQLNQNGHPAMVYLHPWEIDPEQPRLGLTGPAGRRHYHNIDKTLPRLKCLLKKFRFAPVKKVLKI